MSLRDDMLARRDAARKRGQGNRHERRKRKALKLLNACSDPHDEPMPADADHYWMLRLVHPSHRSFCLETAHD